MTEAPKPISNAHQKPRCAPSLRMVRLMGPTGIEEKIKPQKKPDNVASRTGFMSAMSARCLRIFVFLLNFLAPGARNMRADEAVNQIAGKEQWQNVVNDLLPQHQQAADE